MSFRAYFRRVVAGRLLTLLLASGVWAGIALAQSTATLEGTVLDKSGGAVANAKVVVRNQSTGTEWQASTNTEGKYQVGALPAGIYRVEVSAPNFRTFVLKDLKLDVSTTVIEDIPLQVGEVTQQIVVTGEAPVIETGTITVGQTVNQKTVQEIPLNGRHFVDLTALVPGTVVPPQNGFLTAPLRGQGSFGVNTAGGREDTVNFMINGINLNDMVNGQITFQPSINTVQEFKVNNQTFSAEYGRNSGAIVNIATRSGSNEYHGEIFEYHRDNAMDARNFFNPDVTSSGAFAPQSPFIRNSFGANFGGPIKKNKAFFFLTYEGLRQRQGLTLNGFVLSNTDRTNATNTSTVQILKLIPSANSVGKTTTPNDPNSFNGFIGSATAPVNIDQGTSDLSWSISSKDRLHGYVAIQHDLRQEPTLQYGSNSTVPTFGDTRESRRQIVTVNEVHTFSPTLTNEARLGYNRLHITFTPNQQLNPANFSINNGVTTAIGLPQMTIRSLTFAFGGPAGFPQGRGDVTVVLSDTLLYLHGNHSWAIGGEVRRFYNNNFSLDTGTMSFADVAHFDAGQADRYTVTLGNSASRILQPAVGLYAQDNYKWKPNFTLELGLRYDWNGSPSEALNRFVVFVPLPGGTTGDLLQVGTNRIHAVYHNNVKNVQPRLGFAWDPFKTGKTSIRGAYAVLVDQPITNAVTGLTTNPPFDQPITFTGSGGTPFVTFQNALTVAGPAGLAPSAINPSFDNAYVQEWNLNVQREVTPTLGVMVGYFGSKGTHLRILRNINQPIGGVRPFATVDASSPIKAGVALSNIIQTDDGSNSSYNALWFTATKRLSHGFQFGASYSFSKSIDDNSLNSEPATMIVQDSYNIRNDRALSDFDARNHFVLSGLYDLPFKGNRVISGWELGLITTAQSGNPLTIVTGDSAFSGSQTVRPDIIGPVHVTGDPAQFFTNTVCDPSKGACPAGSVFMLPVSAAGKTNHFGNLGRNAIRGPDFVDTDFSLIKNTKITERFNVQFRTEVFNLFNHPNFGNPGRVAAVNSSSFGVITSTRAPNGDLGSARQVQLALKLLF